MGRKKSEPGEKEEAGVSTEKQKVKFIHLWTSEIGLFKPGFVHELPVDTATSLQEEGVVEFVED